MQREIFVVNASIIDANGVYNVLTGYPISFDSKSYGNDIEKAERRAYSAWYECLGAMSKRDDRKEQIAMIIRVSDGLQIEKAVIGKMPDVPVEPEEQAGE